MSFFQLVEAQMSVDSVFCNSKSKVLDLLCLNARMDLLDYFNSGVPMTVENDFKEKSFLLEKSSKLLKLKISNVSRCEILLLDEAAATPLYAVLHTIDSPIGYVRVEIRSNEENLVDSFSIKPQLGEVVDTSNLTNVEVNAFLSCGWVATFSEKDLSLCVKPAIENVKFKCKDGLIGKMKDLVYKWNGTSFVRVK